MYVHQINKNYYCLSVGDVDVIQNVLNSLFSVSIMRLKIIDDVSVYVHNLLLSKTFFFKTYKVKQSKNRQEIPGDYALLPAKGKKLNLMPTYDFSNLIDITNVQCQVQARKKTCKDLQRL